MALWNFLSGMSLVYPRLEVEVSPAGVVQDFLTGAVMTSLDPRVPVYCHVTLMARLTGVV